MARVTVATGPVEYDEAGTGVPVLVLHGTPGGSDQGLAAARALDLDARVIAPSRPGYLGTPVTTGRSPAEQADAMVRLLDALDVEDAVVLGTSGGGMAAVELAGRHPARVRGLVLWSAVTTETARESRRVRAADRDAPTVRGLWTGRDMRGVLSRRRRLLPCDNRLLQGVAERMWPPQANSLVRLDRTVAALPARPSAREPTTEERDGRPNSAG